MKWIKRLFGLRDDVEETVFSSAVDKKIKELADILNRRYRDELPRTVCDSLAKMLYLNHLMYIHSDALQEKWNEFGMKNSLDQDYGTFFLRLSSKLRSAPRRSRDLLDELLEDPLDIMEDLIYMIMNVIDEFELFQPPTPEPEGVPIGAEPPQGYYTHEHEAPAEEPETITHLEEEPEEEDLDDDDDLFGEPTRSDGPITIDDVTIGDDDRTHVEEHIPELVTGNIGVSRSYDAPVTDTPRHVPEPVAEVSRSSDFGGSSYDSGSSDSGGDDCGSDD